MVFMNDAVDSTVMNIAVWGVLLPLLVQALIMIASIRAKGEARADREAWTWRED